jgi:hypothetical protein
MYGQLLSEYKGFIEWLNIHFPLATLHSSESKSNLSSIHEALKTTSSIFLSSVEQFTLLKS